MNRNDPRPKTRKKGRRRVSPRAVRWIFAARINKKPYRKPTRCKLESIVKASIFMMFLFPYNWIDWSDVERKTRNANQARPQWQKETLKFCPGLVSRFERQWTFLDPKTEPQNIHCPRKPLHFLFIPALGRGSNAKFTLIRLSYVMKIGKLMLLSVSFYDFKFDLCLVLGKELEPTSISFIIFCTIVK